MHFPRLQTEKNLSQNLSNTCPGELDELLQTERLGLNTADVRAPSFPGRSSAEATMSKQVKIRRGAIEGDLRGWNVLVHYREHALDGSGAVTSRTQRISLRYVHVRPRRSQGGSGGRRRE